jgi:hypothetical protein
VGCLWDKLGAADTCQFAAAECPVAVCHSVTSLYSVLRHYLT